MVPRAMLPAVPCVNFEPESTRRKHAEAAANRTTGPVTRSAVSHVGCYSFALPNAFAVLIPGSNSLRGIGENTPLGRGTRSMTAIPLVWHSTTQP